MNRELHSKSGGGASAAGSGLDNVLPDVLKPGLRVVFCGTAVAHASARSRAYYAGPGNEFWPVLARLGLTPRLLAPSEVAELPKYGIGLTDLVKLRSGVDARLAASDYDVAGFRQKIAHYAPRVVAFNGKRAARVFFGLRDSEPLAYGLHAERIGGACIHVLPSTSGSARRYWDERWWRELADLASQPDN